MNKKLKAGQKRNFTLAGIAGEGKESVESLKRTVDSPNYFKGKVRWK